MRHVLVIANETVAGQSLLDALGERRPDLVTVICPVTSPRAGYVVYEDTRRASAGRRLERTLTTLREGGIAAHGFVVESDPAEAAKDALATLEPRPTEVVVSTHPEHRSGWLRRHVVDRVRRAVGDLPVEHVVVDLDAERTAQANVLVLANETVLGGPLLDAVRARAARSPASFLFVCPQSDPTVAVHPEAEKRLKRALAILRSEGIDAHGQIAHPDPFAAAMHAVRDERVDEIIVSTFGPERSGWLRRELVERLRSESGVPVEHVVGEPEPAEVG